jgi:hypothetical protein
MYTSSIRFDLSIVKKKKESRNESIIYTVDDSRTDILS